MKRLLSEKDEEEIIDFVMLCVERGVNKKLIRDVVREKWGKHK